jgi:hypothetical protein
MQLEAMSTIHLPIYKGKNAKMSACLIDYAIRHENLWGSGSIPAPFLALAPD